MLIFMKKLTFELANISIVTDGDIRNYFFLLNFNSLSNSLQHSIRERERDWMREREREIGLTSIYFSSFN